MRVLVRNVYVPSECEEIEVDVNARIDTLKQAIAEKFPSKPSIASQKLVFGGQIRKDDEIIGEIFAKNQVTENEINTFHLLIPSTKKTHEESPSRKEHNVESGTSTRRNEIAASRAPVATEPPASNVSSETEGTTSRNTRTQEHSETNPTHSSYDLIQYQIQVLKIQLDYYERLMQLHMNNPQFQQIYESMQEQSNTPMSQQNGARETGLPHHIGGVHLDARNGTPPVFGRVHRAPVAPFGGPNAGEIPIPRADGPNAVNGQGQRVRIYVWNRMQLPGFWNVLNAINFKLVFKLCIMMLLFGQDISAENLVVLAIFNLFVYLYLTGAIGRLVRLILQKLRMIDENHENLEAMIPDSMFTTTISSSGGILSDIQWVFFGFILSLFPIWRFMAPAESEQGAPGEEQQGGGQQQQQQQQEGVPPVQDGVAAADN